MMKDQLIQIIKNNNNKIMVEVKWIKQNNLIKLIKQWV